MGGEAGVEAAGQRGEGGEAAGGAPRRVSAIQADVGSSPHVLLEGVAELLADAREAAGGAERQRSDDLFEDGREREQVAAPTLRRPLAAAPRAPAGGGVGAVGRRRRRRQAGRRAPHNGRGFGGGRRLRRRRRRRRLRGGAAVLLADVAREERDEGLVHLALREVERAPPVHLLRRARARLEEQLRQRHLAAAARHPQGRHAVAVEAVDLRARVQHELDDVEVAALLAVLRERRRAVVAREVDRGARVEQRARRVAVAELARHVERRRAALRVAPVEVGAGCEELAHHLRVAVVRGRVEIGHGGAERWRELSASHARPQGK